MAAKRQAGSQRLSANLRIIGGSLRGRKIHHPQEPGTRPMKDRVREAVFNLVGDRVKSTVAIDLFSGTGAMALEAISRGASRAVAIEKNFPMADLIARNAADLNVADRIHVHAGDAFFWVQTWSDETIAEWGSDAWTVFCCPPYAFYEQRKEQMLALIERLLVRAPSGSALVVEADRRFDFADLPAAAEWDVRPYPPAIVGIYRKSL
jgi:16S rRNA (guanine966-N2)-methyltransferase